MNYDLMYDVILIHPPSIYDFRNRIIFPGALATVDRIQYQKVSLGILSIADYLDKHGYKVIIDNLSDRMVNNKTFDVEEHIRKTSARVYAIGLHWHHHSQGAIEIAKLCKRLHPNSLIIIGGLTATCFHEEIIQDYKFVDAVIRGEAEKPFLQFLRALDEHKTIMDTPNLTYRKSEGQICVTPLMTLSDDLDEFEFTRFDLLDPQTSVFSPGTALRASLITCRGCIYNCVSCGASAYSYNKYLGRQKPAFRSPKKITDDIRKLNKQGITQIGLYQDPRMGGKKYWKELIAALHSEDLEMERLSVDLLTPADEEFIKELSTIHTELVLYMCPDSGSEEVRKLQGRQYSNEEILNTIKLCHKYHMPVVVFFSIGLCGDNKEIMEETWSLWDSICQLNKIALDNGRVGNIGRNILLEGPILGHIIIEPGSLAFDYPDYYGYKIIIKNLKEYIESQGGLTWHQWINYETNQLNKYDLVELIDESIRKYIMQRIKYGCYDNSRINHDYVRAEADKIITHEVNRILKEIPDDMERESRLIYLRDLLNVFMVTSPLKNDPYGYQGDIAKRLLAPYYAK